jgi:ParB family chromosome partitioning protein
VTTKRKAGLGRGLESLIPTESSTRDQTSYQEIPVDGIKPNPDQPRSRFDDEKLDELTNSIVEVGVLQPVVVARGDDGTLHLIAGERRWRAARKAGLATIPAVVRGDTGDTTLVEALVENVQREDLTPLEEAHAYKQLLENTGMNQEQIAKRVGKSRPAVSNTLRLLQLPGPIQGMIDSGSLSAGHARALIGLEDERYAIYLAEKASKEGWSVRQIEEAVRTRRDMDDPLVRSAVRELRPVEIIELEKRLSDRLGSRVRISYGNEKGKVEIRFGSLVELERLYRALS